MIFMIYTIKGGHRHESAAIHIHAHLKVNDSLSANVTVAFIVASLLAEGQLLKEKCEKKKLFSFIVHL